MAFVTQETEFEKRRGISRVEVRHGYAQVHVGHMEARIMEERLRVLAAVADAGVSIDFLKLTPTGLSFIVPDGNSEVVERALRPTGADFEIRRDRSIVLVYAVNIRDEEGLIASIIRTTITTCAQVDHVGDMHDRLLMVIPTAFVDAVARQFAETLHGSGVEVKVS